MSYQWSERKHALQLRSSGLSLRTIEKSLGIAKSTLSGWFREVPLSFRQRQALLKKWKEGLKKAREKAAIRNRAEKQKRLQQYFQEAGKVLECIDFNNETTLELAIAMLYLGEGAKTTSNLRMSNSSPLILKTLLKILEKVYNIDIKKIKCSLNLRADQNPNTLKRFWSKELSIPLENFTYVYVDKRTDITKTYSWYKGVCMVRIGTTAMKERLMYVANGFCERILNSGEKEYAKTI